MKHLFAILLLFGSTVVSASPKGVPLAYVGAGAMSCGKYLSNSDQPDVVFGYISWVQGFLSGANLGFAKKFGLVSLPDYESIKFYMDKYCKGKPLKSVKDGAEQLFIDVHRKDSSN